MNDRPNEPFLQGAVVGMGDDKTRLWGAFNLWRISTLFLVLNALVEAGGVLVGVQGVPGAQAVQNKEYME